jgi:aspartate 1-decarboxylase
VIRTMLQAKLHHVVVTKAVLDYEGSCGIDQVLLDATGMRANQKIDIYNVANGERFSTYIIVAPRGSGEISLNGAAARKVAVGDRLIICAYSGYDEHEITDYAPVVAVVSQQNRAFKILHTSGSKSIPA